MKLTESETLLTAIDIQDGKVVFFDPLLEADIRLNGIFVPEILRDDYGGKTRIGVEDGEFSRAFMELYYPNVYDPDHWVWIE